MNIKKINLASSLLIFVIFFQSISAESISFKPEEEKLLLADEVLSVVLDIEKQLGRVRIEKWGQRLIDIDIIFYNDSMETIMEKFKGSGAWNLPVIKNQKYLGFISKSKLLTAYRNKLIELTNS